MCLRLPTCGGIDINKEAIMFEPVDISNLSQFTTALSDAGTKLVVVDFHAVWCAPCRSISPVVTKLARKHQQIKVLKVGIEITG